MSILRLDQKVVNCGGVREFSALWYLGHLTLPRSDMSPSKNLTAIIKPHKQSLLHHNTNA